LFIMTLPDILKGAFPIRETSCVSRLRQPLKESLTKPKVDCIFVLFYEVRV
jgi:hypothetical protein